jgi:hypothetical protein
MLLENRVSGGLPLQCSQLIREMDHKIWTRINCTTTGTWLIHFFYVWQKYARTKYA